MREEISHEMGFATDEAWPNAVNSRIHFRDRLQLYLT